MRRAVTTGLVALVGFGVSLIGPEIMTDAPTWVWSWLAAVTATGACVLLLLSGQSQAVLDSIDRRYSMAAMVVVFLICGGVGALSYVGVKALRPDMPAADMPIVLEWEVKAFNGKKTIAIQNKGHVAVTDLRVHSIRWELDPKAWQKQTIQIAQWSQWSGGARLLTDILSAGSDFVIDLTGEPFIGVDLLPFAVEKIPEGDPNPQLPPEFLTFYSLRFTFRDSRTGLRYQHYEVISAQADTLLPINTDSGGGGSVNASWILQLPSVIKDAAEKRYLTDPASSYGSKS